MSRRAGAGRVSETRGDAIADRLNAYLDSSGLDAEDLSRKLGIGVARVRLLLQREAPEESEFERIVALLDGA